MKRRDFIRLMGLSSAAAVISACETDTEKRFLIPYLVPPEEEIIHGQPVIYQTSCMECPAHCGVTVKVRNHFPVKLEGNVRHPINQGALCIRGQSSLSRLYHPERIKNPLQKTTDGSFKEMPWEEAFALIKEALRQPLKKNQHHFYLSARTSGSLSDLIDRFCQKMQFERLPEFEIYAHNTLQEAYHVLFGKRELPHFHIEQSDFLITLGADILETFISPVCYAKQFARAKNKGPFHWLHLEPHLSLTGLRADKRLPIHPGSEPYFLVFLLNTVLEQDRIKKSAGDALHLSIPKFSLKTVSSKTGLSITLLRHAANRWKKSKKPLLITGGVSLSHKSGLEASILTGLIQWFSGMLPSLIDFSRSENYSTVGSLLDIQNLSHRIKNNAAGVVFLARTDPLKHLPDNFSLKEDLQKALFRVGLSDLMNETMRECDIILPLSHPLESWGDVQPRKDIRALIQPVLEPLYQTHSEGDILSQLMQDSSELPAHQSFQKHLFQNWANIYGNQFTEGFLDRGFHQETCSQEKLTLNVAATAEFLSQKASFEIASKPLLMMTPSIRLFDGRSAALPLLHEIPDPLTTISHQSWCSVSEKTARENHWRDREEIQLTSSKNSLYLPVKILHGLPENIYLVQKPFLRPLIFEVEKRTGELLSYADKVDVLKTGRSISVPILSGSLSQKGRGEIPRPIHASKSDHHDQESLYPEHDHPDYRWAMAIDLDLCTGCSACVAACYVENNVPIVGSKEHLKGREMSWLRIEPHYRTNHSVTFIPMLCQHCEYAPCEPVCPVYAAYHTPEGLNAQIYNRCVGTRYCSNNCPYKVRRFNWFKQSQPKPLDKMRNPDISIRGSGVMEKCTFCMQRIRAAKDHAKDESRKVQDGEVTPACAQTCPTESIVFGNLLDKNSRINALAYSNRAFRIFESLGTGPAVYYLKSGHQSRLT
jgi:molybdopterin-containing oxidoreductase family iron-sulfur binding subunit